MKHLLWKSEIDIDEWKDFLNEEHPDVDDEDKQYRLCSELNNDYLEDMKYELRKPMEILAIADIGRWNGRRCGYLELDNFAAIFRSYVNGISEIEFYVEDGDVKCTECHHDGTNYYTFYEVRENRYNTDGYQRFLDDLYDGRDISKRRLLYYCKHLGYHPQNIYGWRD